MKAWLSQLRNSWDSFDLDDLLARLNQQVGKVIAGIRGRDCIAGIVLAIISWFIIKEYAPAPVQSDKPIIPVNAAAIVFVIITALSAVVHYLFDRLRRFLALRFRRDARSYLGDFLTHWRHAVSISEEHCQCYKIEFIKSVKFLYQLSRSQRQIKATYMSAFVIFAVTLPSTLPKLLPQELEIFNSSQMLAWFVKIIIFVGGPYAIIGYLFGSNGILRKLRIWRLLFRLAPWVFAAATIGVYASGLGESSLCGRVVFNLFMATTAIMVIDEVFSLFSSMMRNALRSTSESRDPGTHLMITTFLALRTLEMAKGGAFDLAVRLDVEGRMASASRLCRHKLLAHFTPKDLSVVLWRARQIEMLSNAFAEKQTWLMTPQVGTKATLEVWLARITVALISGHWDELDLVESKNINANAPPTRIRRLLVQLSQVTRLVVAAGLPALLYFIALELGFLVDLDPKTTTYVKVGVLVWATLTFLVRLDPEAKEKVSLFRNTYGAFLGKGKVAKDD